MVTSRVLRFLGVMLAFCKTTFLRPLAAASNPAISPRAPLCRGSGRSLGLQSRINAAHVVFENLLAIGVADWRLVNVALGVVEGEAGLGILALHRADHLGREQNIVDRH